MKAILISIKPKYVADILNGKKTIEIRKSIPKCDLPIDVYIYVTKGKPYLYRGMKLDNSGYHYYTKELEETRNNINGKVVAKFTLNQCEMVFVRDILECACLTRKEADDYLEGRPCYAIHITKLEIFDKPKELSEFNVMREYTNCGRCPHALEFGCSSNGWCGTIKPLTRAPQNYCYIEV